MVTPYVEVGIILSVFDAGVQRDIPHSLWLFLSEMKVLGYTLYTLSQFQEGVCCR